MELIAEVNYIKHWIQKLFRNFGHWEVKASSGRTDDQKPDYSHEFRSPNPSEDVQRYETFDPRMSSSESYEPSDMDQSGFRNPLGTSPTFVVYTKLGPVELVGVFCRYEEVNFSES